MNRRQIITLALISSALKPLDSIAAPFTIKADKLKISKSLLKEPLHEPSPLSTKFEDHHIKDYLTKIRHPNRPHKDDIILSNSDFITLENVVNRFIRIRKVVGHGHFCITDFDKAISITKYYPKVGTFTKEEFNFIERVFYQDANDYGFRGEKQITNLTAKFDSRDALKIPYTGNYLFKGDAQKKYASLKKEIGNKLVLTSGIRGVAKQFFLFLNKAYQNNGNLSLASRSLAPPGYSYHSNGDFDVGQKGFGHGNFSEDFTSTSVFHELSQQGYVQYRYTRDNMLGVRYEPWHIKL